MYSCTEPRSLPSRRAWPATSSNARISSIVTNIPCTRSIRGRAVAVTDVLSQNARRPARACVSVLPLFGLDACRLQHFADLRCFDFDELCYALRRRVHGKHTEAHVALLDIRHFDDLREVCIDAADDCWRCALRRKYRPPCFRNRFFTPASAMVGTSGSAGDRSSLATAIARNLPPLI